MYTKIILISAMSFLVAAGSYADVTSSSIIQQRLLGLQAKATNSEHEPIEIDELKFMDCGDLALNAAKANRAKKNILEEADSLRLANEQVSQQSAQAAQIQQDSLASQPKSGGLLSLIGKSAATLGAGTPIGLLGGIVSNLAGGSSQTTPAVSSLVSSTATLASQNEVKMNDQAANQLIKKFEKHNADLENIRILQKSKQCV